MKYEVSKTEILGLGPWFVSPIGKSDVLGLFREHANAKIFADALNATEQAVSPDTHSISGCIRCKCGAMVDLGKGRHKCG